MVGGLFMKSNSEESDPGGFTGFFNDEFISFSVNMALKLSSINH